MMTLYPGLNSTEKIRKKFEIPISPVSTKIALAQTFLQHSIQPGSTHGTLGRRGSEPSTQNFVDLSGNSLGEALFRALYRNAYNSVSITDFCSKLVKEFGNGREVDISSLALAIRPQGGVVNAKVLDDHLFLNQDGLLVHPLARLVKIVDGIAGGLSPQIIEFLKDLVSFMEIETPEQRLNLGLAYYHGVLLPLDYSIAYKYFESAAEGSSEALAYIGVCKLHGRGTAMGDYPAFKTFKASAKRRDPIGMYYLSKCYRFGVGCEADRTRSDKWIERSAESYAVAQLELASRYFGPRETDYSKGLEYYKMAAHNGMVDAQYTLGCCYRYGFHLMINMAEAVKYFHMAANQGDPISQNNLAFMYQKGIGVEKDSEYAFKLFELSAKHRFPEAQLNLGHMYEYGFGCNTDLYMAANLYTLAADAGVAEAQHRLALCYQQGKGKDVEIQQAIFWYRKAIEQQHIPSMNNLALYYELMSKTEEDIKEAIRLLTLASEMGDEIAQFNLIDLYETGAQGVIPTDLESANRVRQLAKGERRSTMSRRKSILK